MNDKYHLMNDICRCHDSACPKHAQCLRWLARKSSRNGGWTNNADTLRNASGECDRFYPAEPDAPFCGCGD